MFTNVFDEYLDHLKRRFSQPQDLISEDCIRYDFFETISKIKNLTSFDFILEYPLNKLLSNVHPQDEIDCVIERLGIICEFKCWKEPKTNNAQSMIEGELFKDLFRLRDVSGFENKWVIVIFHEDMYRHLNNRYGLFNGPDNIHISNDIIRNRGKTFNKASKIHEYSDISIQRIYLRPISNGFRLSIFKLV